MSFPKKLRSYCTTSSCSFSDADENNDPAYLPAGLSSFLGGRWPGTLLIAVALKATLLNNLVSIDYQIYYIIHQYRIIVSNNII